MRLQHLYVDGYKNLIAFRLPFKERNGISVLLGLNGAGKSNVLEAISIIFASLYRINMLNSKPAFDFEIAYECSNADVLIKYVKGGTYAIEIDGERITPKEFSNDDELLPNKIICCYSGEENRIWRDVYEPFYRSFRQMISRSVSQSLPSQRLYYINKYYWPIALLTLIYGAYHSQLENCKQFLERDLGIISISAIKFEFDHTLLNKRPETDLVADFVRNHFAPREGFLTKYSLTAFCAKELGFESELFQMLTAAFLPTPGKLIKNIAIEFDTLSLTALSEGEKKLLLIKCILEFLADEESLVLLDEPDSHIHIARQQDLKALIEDYSNRETILTTHSPALAHAFSDNHLVPLRKEKGKAILDNTDKYRLVENITGGLLSFIDQAVFYAGRKHILLVEGRHDKTHISNALRRLSDKFPALDFDIYDMGGEANVKQLMIGFANCGQVFKKKIIALYDNDKAGRDATTQNYIKDKGYHRLRDNAGAGSSTFLAAHLLKPDGFDGDCTIENLLPAEKYAKAYEYALADTLPYFNRGIETISEDIKLKSKNKLAEMSSEFEESDFTRFVPLFELLEQLLQVK